MCCWALRCMTRWPLCPNISKGGFIHTDSCVIRGDPFKGSIYLVVMTYESEPVTVFQWDIITDFLQKCVFIHCVYMGVCVSPGLPGLRSWCPIFKSSHRDSYEDRVPLDFILLSHPSLGWLYKCFQFVSTAASASAAAAAMTLLLTSKP